MSAVAQRQLSRPPARHVPTVIEFAEIAKFCTDLRDDLEEMVRAGILEAFRDENNVLRFKPAAGASL
jgi:hypothetical protein